MSWAEHTIRHALMYRCVYGCLCLKWRFGGKRRDIHISHAYIQQALMLSSPRVNYRTRSHTPEIAPFILIEHCGNWRQPLCLLSVHGVGCVSLRVRVTLSVLLPHKDSVDMHCWTCVLRRSTATLKQKNVCVYAAHVSLFHTACKRSMYSQIKNDSDTRYTFWYFFY